MIAAIETTPAARGRCPTCRRLFALNRFGEHAGRLRRHANLFADGIPCAGSHGEPMPADPPAPPPMPGILGRLPDEPASNWIAVNRDAVLWFLENQETVREAMAGRGAVAC